MEVGNGVCVAQVLLPPAKANGLLLCESPLDSAQLSHPCERFGGQPSARNNFSHSAALVNKNISILLTPPALAFQVLSSTLPYPFLFDTHLRNQNIPLSIPSLTAPSTFYLIVVPGTFQLLLTLGGFQTRHNSEYPPSICGIFTKSIGSCPKANSFHQWHFWVHQLLDRERPQVHSRHFSQWSAAISGVYSTSSRKLYADVVCLQACHV
jgi:hypothetical protein